ncbi:MAG: anthranilate phosphoribosyltransferase [OM182 bacterium]|nr:MAG: anthranilate phosphoribosyltransferase [OM182 bacterium]|tara:strand:- start:6525 stop:7577 length:1053 start_codon:yes stop_codon:yes gene_type:complete
MDIPSALAAIVDGRDLSQAEAASVFNDIMSGAATPGQIGAILAALRVKGETAAEIAGAATTMRALSTKVPVSADHLVDTCGTGGSGLKLFNISTASAFVAAAAGAQVAKHGNRKMTSFCGSADVLELAGVNLTLTPEQIATCIQEVGVGFMFAPAHHSAMRFAGPIRQEIGIRTLMNVLGPMTNPAGAEHQVIGVFAPNWLRKMAEVLKILGTRRAMILHSEGLDEIRLDAPTQVIELKDGVIEEYILAPKTLGIRDHSPAEIAALAATSTESSLDLVLRSLGDDQSAAADIVALNAGAAIYVSGVATNLSNGVEMAQDAIASGLARERLDELIRVSRMMTTTEADASSP